MLPNLTPVEPASHAVAYPVLTGLATPLLSVREVAARLGVCAATVYALCARGELVHVRVSNAIRVAPADFSAFQRRQRQP